MDQGQLTQIEGQPSQTLLQACGSGRVVPGGLPWSQLHAAATGMQYRTSQEEKGVKVGMSLQRESVQGL